MWLSIVARRTPAGVLAARGARARLKQAGMRTQYELTGSQVAVRVWWTSPAHLRRVLHEATRWAVQELRADPLPPLHGAGVRYQREPMCHAREDFSPARCEEFVLPHEVVARGWGDCDDLAIWRAGELRMRGEMARPVVVRSPGVGYHVIVRRGDGRREDPSRDLGMQL